jgi:tetratricopeptide (TPR) repeat protein
MSANFVASRSSGEYNYDVHMADYLARPGTFSRRAALFRGRLTIVLWTCFTMASCLPVNAAVWSDSSRLASHYYAEGNFSKAVLKYKQSLKEFGNAPNMHNSVEVRANLMLNLASALFSLGDMTECGSVLDQVERSMPSINNNQSLRIRLLRRKYQLLSGAGRYREAAAFQTQLSLLVSKMLGQYSESSISELLELQAVQLRSCDFAASVDTGNLILKAMEIRGTPRGHESAVAKNCLAVALINLKRGQDAARMSEANLRIATEEGFLNEAARAAMNIGLIAESKLQKVEASRWYRISAEHWEATGLASAESSLAHMHALVGLARCMADHKSGMVYLRGALADAEKLEHRYRMLNIEQYRSQVIELFSLRCIERGQLAEAEALLKWMIPPKYAKNTSEIQSSYRPRVDLMKAFEKKGQRVRALNQCDQLLKLFHSQSTPKVQWGPYLALVQRWKERISRGQPSGS